MRHAELKVTSGKQAGSVIALPAGKFLIGREEDCHLRPNSDLVSRHHCVFTVDEFAVRIRDLGSTNGTFVNGERLRGAVMLNAGDTVSIGKIDFQVVITDASQDTATHMSFESDTHLSDLPSVLPPAEEPAPPVGTATIVAEAPLPAADTLAEMPAAPAAAMAAPGAPPQGDTQFMNPMGMPMAPTLGYPPMGYPQMQMPMMPYGYPGYPGMYPQQPMGYPMPGMPGMYPQMPAPQMPAPAPAAEPEPAAKAAAADIVPTKLPNPDETGARPPEPKPAPPPGGETKTADAKAKEEAPKRADDIIQQMLKRRPSLGGK